MRNKNPCDQHVIFLLILQHNMRLIQNQRGAFVVTPDIHT